MLLVLTVSIACAAVTRTMIKRGKQGEALAHGWVTANLRMSLEKC
jgi:hypothetical protein